MLSAARKFTAPHLGRDKLVEFRKQEHAGEACVDQNVKADLNDRIVVIDGRIKAIDDIIATLRTLRLISIKRIACFARSPAWDRSLQQISSP